MNSHAPRRLHHSRMLSGNSLPISPKWSTIIRENPATIAGAPQTSACQGPLSPGFRKKKNWITHQSRNTPNAPGTTEESMTIAAVCALELSRAVACDEWDTWRAAPHDPEIKRRPTRITVGMSHARQKPVQGRPAPTDCLTKYQAATLAT